MTIPFLFLGALKRYAEAAEHHCLSYAQVRGFREIEKELRHGLAERVQEQAKKCPREDWSPCKLLLNLLGRR